MSDEQAPTSNDTLDIVGRVLELPPDDREEAARALCGSNSDQLRQVKRLIELEAAAHDFLERPLIATSRHSTIAPGKRIDRYTLVRLLGAGGSAMVYEAIQDGTGQRVALKTLRPELMTTNSIRRLEFEAEALGRLKHSGIAHVYECGSFMNENEERCPYLALEFVEGADILTHCESRKLSMNDTLRLIQRVCDAVEHAHQRGVIHRDLKPANILVDPTGQPKILDFGIARAIERDESRTQNTRSGDVLGTVQYMSPEQTFADEDGTTIRSDVYSLGVLAYRLVAGRFPYASRPTILGTADLLRTAEPARPGVSRDLETILLKAIAKHASRRYATAEDLRADIDRFLSSRPIEARPPTVLDRTGKFVLRNWRRLVLGSVVLVALTSPVMIYLSAQSSLEILRAKSAILELKEKEQEQRAKNAQLLTSLITKYLRTTSEHGVGANWLHILSFIESMMGSGINFDPADTEKLWESRVKVAKSALADAKAKGKQDEIEALMLESSLCLWLLRVNNGKEALEHLDAIEPKWRRMLKPEDEWFIFLDIFRKCGEVLVIDPKSPGAAEKRLALFTSAVQQSSRLGETGRPVRMLLEKIKPIAELNQDVPAPP
jgi:serine/threonine protein kinase